MTRTKLAKRRAIQPDGLHVTVWKGHTLYSHVVAVEGRRLVFVSGQVPFDRDGNIVGPGDMRAQIRQVGENEAAEDERPTCRVDPHTKDKPSLLGPGADQRSAPPRQGKTSATRGTREPERTRARSVPSDPSQRVSIF